MCGRYGLSSSGTQIIKSFGLKQTKLTLNKARLNIAPSEKILTINAEKKTAFPRWGVNHPGTKSLVINARLENLTASPLWSQTKRIIVPANFFYEWQMDSYGKKVPWLIRPISEVFFRLAALYFPPEDATVILTTAACDLLKSIHNHGPNKHRQPMTLDQQESENWLSGQFKLTEFFPLSSDRFITEELEQPANDKRGQTYKLKKQKNLF
jgi:putative SOS response-associated peptidase YedK